MGIVLEKQEITLNERNYPLKPECRPKGRHSWALWLPN
jgi:hypothetical protein